MQVAGRSLEEKIASKIDEIRAIEKNFPGAIIIHDLEGKVVYMSKWGRDYLGTTNEQLRNLGMEYYSRYFNGDDAKDYVPKILGLLERNNDDEFISFFQQVRQSPGHEWAWYLSAVKIFVRDNDGKPMLTLTQALPVDAQHHIAAKAQRLLEENGFLRKNYHVFDQLTKREKEILRLMALGDSSLEIAGKLGISDKTAKTHRKNIRRKLNVENNYDLIRFSQAFDLI
jgi:DNA-binding CsgD family transcriptional regulator